MKERFNLTRQGLADPSQLVSACAELGAQGCAGQMGRIVVEIDMTLPAAKATLDLASKGLSLARSASRPPLEMPSDPYSPDWARYYADNPEAVRFGPGAMREGELSMNPAAGRQVTDPIVVSPEEMLAIAKSVRRQVDKLNTRGLNSSGRAFQAAVSSGDYRVAGTIAHNRMFKRLASRDFRTLSGERVLINRGRVYPPPGVEPSRGYFWRTPDIQYGSPGSLKYRAWDFKGSQSGWPYPDPTGQFADLLDWTKVQPEALFYHWR